MPENVGLFLSLLFPSNPGTHITSSEVLLRWEEVTDRQCSACGNQTVKSRTKLHNVGGYLAVCLRRYHLGTGKVNTQVTNFQTSRVIIDGFHFNTVGAIIHNGKEIHEGNYTSFLKKSTGSGWWLCDDTTITERERFVQQLRDVYILILKKV
jgi:hypothetical protein